MRRFAILCILWFAAIARADDVLDKAIADLGADTPELREAAEKKITASGEAALESCRTALGSATDPEVRARLKRIVDGLDLAKKWGKTWKDRWFRITSGERYVGWMHETAEPAEVEGRSGWVFHSETSQTQAGQLLHFVSDLRCRSDAILSPVSGRYRFEGGGNKLDVKLSFGADYWIADDGLVRAHLHEGSGVTMSVDLARADEKGAKEDTKK